MKDLLMAKVYDLNKLNLPKSKVKFSKLKYLLFILNFTDEKHKLKNKIFKIESLEDKKDKKKNLLIQIASLQREFTFQ